MPDDLHTRQCYCHPTFKVTLIDIAVISFHNRLTHSIHAIIVLLRQGSIVAFDCQTGQSDQILKIQRRD